MQMVAAAHMSAVVMRAMAVRSQAREARAPAAAPAARS